MKKTIPGPKGHWLFGSLFDVLPRIHRFPAEAAWAHGGLAQFRVLNRKLIVTARPDHVQHILLDNVNNYIKSFHYRSIARFVGPGIIFSDGELWRERRRQVQPAFNKVFLKSLVDVVNGECVQAMDRWDGILKEEPHINVAVEARTLALRVITRALLGIELENAQARTFGDAVARAMYVMGRRNNTVVFPLWVPTKGNRAIVDTRRVLDDFLSEQIRTRKQMLASGAQTPGGILEMFLRPEAAATELAQDDDALLVEIKTLFLAGFETASTTLAWALYMFATHPEEAQACREEVDRVLGNRMPGYEDLPLLEKVAGAILETMRLYPPLVQLGREAVAEDVLDRYRIPKGATVLISVFGLHRSPELWDDPDAFRPERFAPGKREAIPKHAYIPFGAGRRLCMGNNFAMIEEVAILALILQRYRLELEPGFQAQETMRVTLNPGPYVPIRMVRRDR